MIEVRDLGIITYKNALEVQENYFFQAIENRKNQIPNAQVLLVVEHEPVYTLGKNGKTEHLLPIARLSGADFYETNRGGDITYHGPGQIVAYPIFDLAALNIGLARYVFLLEQIGIDLCAHYGINASRSDKETGVWLDIDGKSPRKIMAIGIKASRQVVMHGLAFNVQTELKYFDYIIPCGIQGKGVTSLEKELNQKLDFQAVKLKMIESFRKYFDLK
jgi:lipoyl(octanoyl) transferase